MLVILIRVGVMGRQDWLLEEEEVQGRMVLGIRS